ncbi:MAG TPA: methyltransferase domain-containing protein [Ktedonobacteraceae bacterium]|jgi:SAM-dependent methyltransferase
MFANYERDRAAFFNYLQSEYEAPFSGWDFSHLDGRMVEDLSILTWDYRVAIEAHLPDIHSLLDIDTGGGEFLASLEPLPADTCATESYAPNIPVARRRLEPLGVQVYAISEERLFPSENERFDLVINRHGAYSPSEVSRVLKPGGLLITQQVDGAGHFDDFNHALGALAGQNYPHWQLAYACKGLKNAGFEILERAEARPTTRFYDVGALVYYLKVIPWQINDFSVEKYLPQLEKIRAQIQRDGSLVVHSHYFFVIARKP